MAALYAQVIIPRPLDGTFTYRVPPRLEEAVGIGYRVIVPFGARRYLTGIIESLAPVRPADVAGIKDIEGVLDTAPMVVSPQIRLWQWIAGYYMCAVGDVMKAAMPAGLKVESETVVELADGISDSLVPALGETDTAIISALCEKPRMTIRDLARRPGITNVERRVAVLVEAGVLAVHETLVNRYRRVKMKMIRPLIPRGDSEALARAFEAVRRSEAQQTTLMHLLALSGFNRPAAPLKAVSRDELLDASDAITFQCVKALENKGLVEITTREISRFSAPEECTGCRQAPLPVLSPAQETALHGIHRSLIDHNVTLLHGVTSSGKTEVYIHLIDYTLAQKRQALMLVPEIALTTQLTRRLQRVFGDRVRIYHSKFSDNERVDIWRDMLAHPDPCVVIGARSAVFLPFRSLGLVIVDEEHDPSYKQADPAPRYNGRDTAIVLASFHGAKTVLGSATPSVETYYKATETGKYGLVTLSERYGNAVLPEIEVVDMKKEHKKHAVDGMLSFTAIADARRLVKDGRQVIFFHNRRGFSPRARCRLCQFTPKCDHCDVSLTYHRRTATLECHYCGAIYPVPKVCPACHEPAIEIEGYGTERIEDGMSTTFPEARVMRMDLDSTRNKDAFATMIDNFSSGKADILVGTQMVTKGLDFKKVGLVGILNADSLLAYPDFKANERAFNLMEQVAGRAGRDAGNKGKVIIQAYETSSPVIGFVSAHDYQGFYTWELGQRRAYLYPPFVRIINVILRHHDRGAVERFASAYAGRLRQLLGNRVNGPVEPAVERVASQYIRRVMLKIEPAASVMKVREVLRSVFLEFNESPVKSGVSVHYDVDPA